jgi:arylsulfatase A-like enzyme
MWVRAQVPERPESAPMDTNPSEPGTRRQPSRILLSPAGTVPLAIALGLCGGYLDLIALTFKKYYLNELRYFWTASDFPWSVPVTHVVLSAIAGVLVAVVNWVRPGRPMTLRAGAWLFTTLAIWAALLRMPLYGVCSLLLAAGLGRPISVAVASCCQPARRARYALAGLLGLLIVLAALSSGRQAMRKYRAVSNLPAPPLGARNVVLIVWDTVRAPSLSLYGYHRDTTPNLQKWARTGVRHAMALVPAPWTYPSHSSFFTGRWPYQLNSQWNYSLDATYPTLAEFLASRGYQTVGFVANTRGCSYETGLDRGFAEYEDFPLTPRFLLGRTVPGSWILKNLLGRGDFYDSKWIDLQSRDARGINDAFLEWLRRRRHDRPFFAFLNYFDAHSPYVPPPEYAGRFGMRPEFPEDYELLFDIPRLATSNNWRRNFLMAQDRYDDCIASLDDQLGRLLESLRGQGLLDSTLVIITSDHGESFGDHRVLGHGAALYLDQTLVPLVILSPDAPAGRTITHPVSLRDLPATIVDQLGLSAGSPFPGQSLTPLWSTSAGQAPPQITPAFSEMAQAAAFRSEQKNKPTAALVQMSLVVPGWHYIRDRVGLEQLYDLRRDSSELLNVAGAAEVSSVLEVFRRTLLDVLTADRGSTEVENLYLARYRRSLKSQVQASSPLPGPMSAVESLGMPPATGLAVGLDTPQVVGRRQ